jgi:hypothetical protein
MPLNAARMLGLAAALLLAGCAARSVPEPGDAPTARGATPPGETSPGPRPVLLGTWRGLESARDEQGSFEVEARFEFGEDGRLSARVEFPDPIGKQWYGGSYKFVADDVVEVRLDRWGDIPRKFKVVVPGEVLTQVGEGGKDVMVLTRVK